MPKKCFRQISVCTLKLTILESSVPPCINIMHPFQMKDIINVISDKICFPFINLQLINSCLNKHKSADKSTNLTLTLANHIISISLSLFFLQMAWGVSCVDTTLNRSFYKLGKIIGRNPGYFIIVPVLLTIIFITG